MNEALGDAQLAIQIFDAQPQQLRSLPTRFRGIGQGMRLGILAVLQRVFDPTEPRVVVSECLTLILG